MAPTVIVPVLSNTTVRMSRACSKALADVTSTPFVAPRPVAAVTDSGVASPSAQGHAMINTLTAVTSAWASLGCGPNVIHMAPVHNAAIITAGTNTRAILSARRCTGALVACARATRAMIWESTVSSPVRVTFMTTLPCCMMVAPVRGSPTPRRARTDSPVIMDSSTLASPANTTPSSGMRSPARITSRSPVFTRSMSMSWDWAGSSHPSPDALPAARSLASGVPTSRMWATRGRSLISDCTAFPVPSRAFASNRRPTRTSVITTPTDSK